MKNVKKDKTGKIISFTISRKTWLRGHGGDFSALLWTKESFKRLCSELDNSQENLNLAKECQGKMCCLGIGARLCGVPKKALDSVATPRDLSFDNMQYFEKVEKGFPWLLSPRYSNMNDKAMFKAMSINDDKGITDRVRESELKKLFKKYGCVVKFVP